MLVNLGQLGLHVVAQIVKTQFVVRGIGHIRTVRFGFLVFGLLREDHTACHTKLRVDLAHPFAITLGEIVVHRNDMNTSTRERIQIGRKGRDKGFTFAGFHFRDIALVQENAAH